MTSNGYEVLCWGGENVLELVSNDGRTTLPVHLKPLDGTFLNGEFYGIYVVSQKNFFEE